MIYLKIFHQSNIYEQILGGMVGFDFEIAYKLQMVAQRETLCIRGDYVSCYRLCMNLVFFEDLVASSVFHRLPKET